MQCDRRTWWHQRGSADVNSWDMLLIDWLLLSVSCFYSVHSLWSQQFLYSNLVVLSIRNNSESGQPRWQATGCAVENCDKSLNCAISHMPNVKNTLTSLSAMLYLAQLRLVLDNSDWLQPWNNLKYIYQITQINTPFVMLQLMGY